MVIEGVVSFDVGSFEIHLVAVGALFSLSRSALLLASGRIRVLRRFSERRRAGCVVVRARW